MVLLTWRLMPAEMHPRWNREAWESQFYFTSRTLSGNKSLFALDAGSRHPLPTALAAPSPDLVHQRTLSGSKSLFALDAGSRHPLPTALAAPSPDLVHQPHFVWEQESLRS